MAFAGLVGYVQMGEPKLTGVEEPERALALVVGRTMDVEAALARAPAWERSVYALTLADSGSEIGRAITWYEELAAYSLLPDVDLRLAILLGEAGRRPQLAAMTARWASRGEPLATWALAVEAVYLGARDPDAPAIAATQEALGPGWFADALVLRAAPRLGDIEMGERATAARIARAEPLLTRMRLLTALDVVLLVLGVVALRALWRRRHAGRPLVADAALPPPWSLGAGLAALVRGGAAAALVLFTLLFGSRWLLKQPVLAEALDQPLMYLPLLAIVWHSLLRPAGTGFVATFGLRPRRDGWWPLVLTAVALSAAGVVMDVVLGVLSERLGLVSHWAEWFDADLAWGGRAAVAVTLLGVVVFAPVFEELIFRGVLYGTLRARLPWPVAAVSAALVFALAHGYGSAGFLSVLVSGLLWSWAYERTGSILPGVAAHVANNAGVALTLTLLLR